MHQITSDKFRILQGNTSTRFYRKFPTGRKSHLVIINGKNTAVGNSNLMSVFSKILNGISESIESFFDIRPPVFSVKRVTKKLHSLQSRK